MRKFLLIIFSFLMYSQQLSAHKFYVSITDMTYNSNSKSLEIVIKCFVDDLEKTIKSVHGQSLFLATEKESEQSDSILELYTQKHFSISTEEKIEQLNYLGHESDQDYVWIYVEIPKFKPKLPLNIKHSFLFELFNDQQNKIRLLMHEQSFGGTCTKNQPTIQFN